MTNYNERLDDRLSTNQKIEIADLMRNADNHDTLNEQIERVNRWAREQDELKELEEEL